MSAAKPTVLVMAAGQGTRMRSSLPKVLHPLCGRPMVEWVVAAAATAGAGRIVCVTRPGQGVAEHLPGGVEVAEQVDGEGTGAAVLAAREQLEEAGTVLILSGDHPLVSSDLIAELAAAHVREGAAATLLTTQDLDPTGYGRVVRAADGSVEEIVETKHPEGVADEILALREVNIGTYAFDGAALLEALDRVEERDGERYLTAVFPLIRAAGHGIAALATSDLTSAMGVNSRAELMDVERIARERIVRAHAVAGVSFPAPESVIVEAGVEIGENTTIDAGSVLRGSTRIGAGCQVGPQSTLIDATLGDDVRVLHSYLTDCEVHDRASVGPFAYLRPGTVIEERAKVGTFVEIKGSRIGRGAKVPHLSYLGDADVGEEANIAAGNITANYDGFAKHRTTIGARVKTGVNTSLVAPVTVGDDAYTGAGSVITHSVPPGALGVSRAPQQNVEGYAERAERLRRK